MEPTFTADRRNVHSVRYEPRAREPFRLLLTSDWHYDNPHCRRELLHSHLDQAAERGAYVCCFGDLFCAMQGKYDPRASKVDIRPEHMTSNYLDTLVTDTAERLRPWHDRLWILGLGNHETSIMRRQETNLIERLVQTIKIMTPTSPVQAGGYGGYARVIAATHGKARGMVNIKYFHGSGGGGPVTKGAIQQQRHAVIYGDADIVYAGHVHEAQSTAYVKERISPAGYVELREQEHLRGATYKEEYDDGHSGWHVESGRPPKPMGGWWLDVEVRRTRTDNTGGRSRSSREMRWSATRAK